MPTYPIHDSPFFDIREWVDERTWNLRGLSCASLIEPRQVRISDLLRELANAPNVINNWHFYRPGPGRKKFVASGFRAVWENTGGDLSQHRRGCASDNKIEGLNERQMFEIVMDNRAAFLAVGLTTIEDVAFTPGWLHLDSRPRILGLHPENDFLIVRP